jgi:preprotein translocase subunit SecG
MLLGLLLTLNIMICLALIGVVLLQRSEGGALGGGSPTGLITTRGAGDLLTRTTWVLFSLFLTISLALTLLGGHERSSQAILNRLKLQRINPDTLPAPTSATPAPSSSAGVPAPLLAPTSQPPAPATAPAPGRTAPLSAPTPKVRIPAAPKAGASSKAVETNTTSTPTPAPPATRAAEPPAPSAPSVPKLLTPTPAPLSIPPVTPAKPAGGDAPVNTGPQ